jgi:hypothetical protein
LQLLLSDKIVEFLRRRWPEIDFYLFKSSPDEFISCFVAVYASEGLLVETWESITSVIAAEYQQELDCAYAAWNIYLACICNEPVRKEVKYRIENDRFALRKMVLDGNAGGLSIEAIKSDLDEIILASGLQVSSAQDKTQTPPTPGLLQDLIDNWSPIPGDGKESSINIRRAHISSLLERNLRS